jgi:lipopolysaccharide export LptBFGC system permease protein LptF
MFLFISLLFHQAVFSVMIPYIAALTISLACYIACVYLYVKLLKHDESIGKNSKSGKRSVGDEGEGDNDS